MSEENQDEKLRMSIWGHLDELRIRLFHSVLAIIIMSAIMFSTGPGEVVVSGYHIPMLIPTSSNSFAADAFVRMKHDLLPSSTQLITQSPIDAMLSLFQVAVLLGIMITMPIHIYEFVKFVSPGLYPEEKRIMLLAIPSATLLFIAGCLFSYTLIAPFTFSYLYDYAGYIEATPMITVQEFLTFSLLLVLMTGILFELPVFMAAFTGAGIIPSSFWKRRWREAVMVIVIVAAVITPDGTGVTQILITIPMLLLYWSGYIASVVVERRMQSSVKL